MCNGSINMEKMQDGRLQKMSSYARRILQHESVAEIDSEDGVTEKEVNEIIEEIAQINPSLYMQVKATM